MNRRLYVLLTYVIPALISLCLINCTTNLSYQPGAVAITVANPTDLVKVRLQAEGKLPPGVPRRYTGALNAYSTIVRQVLYLK